MNKHFMFISVCVLFAGANLYFYDTNASLRQAISAAGKTCNQRVTELRESMKTQSVPQTQERVAKVENRSRNIQAASTAPLPDVNLANMVSYKHRVQAVTNKYDFLLETAQLQDTGKQRLRRLLTQRENLANQIAFAEHDTEADLINLDDALYKVEDQIYLLLKDPIDYERYQYLKQRDL